MSTVLGNLFPVHCHALYFDFYLPSKLPVCFQQFSSYRFFFVSALIYFESMTEWRAPVGKGSRPQLEDRTEGMPRRTPRTSDIYGIWIGYVLRPVVSAQDRKVMPFEVTIQICDLTDKQVDRQVVQQTGSQAARQTYVQQDRAQKYKF